MSDPTAPHPPAHSQTETGQTETGQTETGQTETGISETGPGPDKSAFRRAARRHRAGVARAAGHEAGEAASALFFGHVPLDPHAAVSAYWPFGDELDVRPLLTRLHRAGHPCALPVVDSRDAPLRFREWHPDMALVEGDFGILEPPASAPLVTPDLVVAPMLAFDGGGYRMGYGGGFYDRTLEGLRKAGGAGRGGVLAVGYAYAGQEVEAVPREAHDQPLDWIVTESFARKIR